MKDLKKVTRFKLINMKDKLLFIVKNINMVIKILIKLNMIYKIMNKH